MGDELPVICQRVRRTKTVNFFAPPMGTHFDWTKSEQEIFKICDASAVKQLVCY